jgi:hypothetical protein
MVTAAFSTAGETVEGGDERIECLVVMGRVASEAVPREGSLGARKGVGVVCIG